MSTLRVLVEGFSLEVVVRWGAHPILLTTPTWLSATPFLLFRTLAGKDEPVTPEQRMAVPTFLHLKPMVFRLLVSDERMTFEVLTPPGCLNKMITGQIAQTLTLTTVLPDNLGSNVPSIIFLPNPLQWEEHR